MDVREARALMDWSAAKGHPKNVRIEIVMRGLQAEIQTMQRKVDWLEKQMKEIEEEMTAIEEASGLEMPLEDEPKGEGKDFMDYVRESINE